MLIVSADVREGATIEFAVTRDGGLPLAHVIGAAPMRLAVPVEESLQVGFASDRVDADGQDWNLYVWDVRCEPG